MHIPLPRLSLGFTGTQIGMTAGQQVRLRNLLVAAQPHWNVVFHHGDCVGADAQADAVARELGIHRVSHPPTVESKRAFCHSEVILPARPYLLRNRDIVRACHVLLATPKTDMEELRSGTWATVREAGRLQREAIVLLPSGGHLNKWKAHAPHMIIEVWGVAPYGAVNAQRGEK